MTPQNPSANRMEGPRPQSRHILRHQFPHPLGHFTRRLVGEGEQENPPHIDAPINQPRHPIGQCPRLARSRARNDERLAITRRHRAVLLGIQCLAVVNTRGISTRRSMQLVLTRHRAEA